MHIDAVTKTNCECGYLKKNKEPCKNSSNGEYYCWQHRRIVENEILTELAVGEK